MRQVPGRRLGATAGMMTPQGFPGAGSTMRSPAWADGACVVAGGLMFLAFSPWNLAMVAVASLAVLFRAVLRASPRRAFWRGWLFGAAGFGAGLWWIAESFQYRDIGIGAAAAATALLVAVLALYPALFVGERRAPARRRAAVRVRVRVRVRRGGGRGLVASGGVDPRRVAPGNAVLRLHLASGRIRRARVAARRLRPARRQLRGGPRRRGHRGELRHDGRRPTPRG